MAVLPNQILPEAMPFTNEDGTNNHNWWLLFYNFSQHILGNGSDASAFDTLAQQIIADLDLSPVLSDFVLAPYLNNQQTAAEIAANVTPVNFGYAPGNVLRYGADPSATRDSTAAINQAIAVANAQGGGVVTYPAGRFLVGSAGVFINYVLGSIMHQGASREATLIINGSTNQPAIQCGNGITQIYGGGIRDMSFSQKSGVTAVVGNAAFLYSLVGQFTIRDVFISNNVGAPYRGAYFTGPSYNNGCSQCLIENLEIQGCLDVGFSNVFGVDFYMHDCRCDANSNGGYALNGSQGGYYRGCTAFGNGGEAWNLSSTLPASAPNKNNFFAQCVGDTSGSYNWLIGDSQDSGWVGCWGSTQLSPTVNTFAAGFVITSQYSQRLTFTSCISVNNNAHGLQIFDAGAAAPTAISFHNCQSTSNGIAAGGGYGLTFNGVTNQIRVDGGNYAGNVTGSILNQSSQPDITISGNPVGFVSTNQGAGIITTTNTSVVITHGLGFTPNLTNIQVNDTSSKAASGINSVWTSTPTSTTFTVNTNAAVAGSSFNFAWRASYNGT